MWVGKFTTTTWRVVLRCGPLGGPHTEAGVHGSMGEGLEAVVLCPAVEEVGSSFGPGDSDPIWNLDDFL